MQKGDDAAGIQFAIGSGGETVRPIGVRFAKWCAIRVVGLSGGSGVGDDAPQCRVLRLAALDAASSAPALRGRDGHSQKKRTIAGTLRA